MRLGVLVLVVGCASSSPMATCPEAPGVREAELGGGEQLVERADEIAWGPCPPSLPEDCEMAVLEGSPREAMLFTVRIRTTTAFELQPHWHPNNERVTILEGNVGVGFGEVIDRENVRWFGPGDYYVNAKEAHHFVLSEGPVLLQITGLGPWKVNFVDAN